MRLLLASFFSALSACAGGAHADLPELRLEATLESLAARHPGKVIAIAVHDLVSDRRSEVNGEVTFHAASTMKVAVLVEVFRQYDDHRLRPGETLLVRNEFASLADGSSYRLDPGDDTDLELYAKVGTPVTIRDLVARMIDRSSNLATNLLLEKVGVDEVQKTMAALGCPGLQVLRGVEDSKAFERGLVNTTTARDLANLLVRIARLDAALPESCREMTKILLAQTDRDAIPAGLPPGTPVAHKTGEITRVRHDAGIIDPFGADPWVLVVLSRGFDDPADASRAIAEITRALADRRRKRRTRRSPPGHQLRQPRMSGSISGRVIPASGGASPRNPG